MVGPFLGKCITNSLPKLALTYDSFPPLVNEDECSAQYFSVSENRILFCCCYFFSISAFFDKAEVIQLTGKRHYIRNSIHPRKGR